MKHFFLLSILTIGMLINSCQKKYNCQSFNSEIVSDTLSLSSFDKIQLKTQADVIYLQGNEQFVSIEAPEKLLEHISVSVFQNSLVIDMKHQFCYTNKQNIKLYVTTPSLNEIDIKGSGNFKVTNLLQSESLNISISGSGNFYADSISTDYISTSISGSGDVYIAGKDTIQEQNIKISGSGDVNSYKIPASKTAINISGSGDCKVQTLDELIVKISGSGDVRYIGQPLINSTITGSGSIKQY
ncbi:MAG: head GIN domain-containing protein [Putridiphycobacter sp.]|nr:head GIN domain-containing protein [Putridiphycobacter sp.]